MANLERSMFVLPDQFAVQHDEMYVRYPLAKLSSQLVVREMWLHLSLPATADAVVLQCMEVVSQWEENVFLASRPAHRPALIAKGVALPHQAEISVSITPLVEKWLFSGENWGMYIRFAHQGYAFDATRPPVLEMVYDTLEVKGAA